MKFERGDSFVAQYHSGFCARERHLGDQKFFHPSDRLHLSTKSRVDLSEIVKLLRRPSRSSGEEAVLDGIARHPLLSFRSARPGRAQSVAPIRFDSALRKRTPARTSLVGMISG